MKQETTTKSYNNFEKDLVVGQNGESIVASILSRKGYGKTFLSNDTSDYDLCIETGKLAGTTFEVKYDQYDDTGNMAIEIYCLRRFKPTGIAISKSDYYCYIFKHSRKCLFIKTAKLKKLISSLSKVKIITGGDNNQSVIILLKYKEHRKEFAVFSY